MIEHHYWDAIKHSSQPEFSSRHALVFPKIGDAFDKAIPARGQSLKLMTWSSFCPLKLLEYKVFLGMIKCGLTSGIVELDHHWNQDLREFEDAQTALLASKTTLIDMDGSTVQNHQDRSWNDNLQVSFPQTLCWQANVAALAAMLVTPEPSQTWSIKHTHNSSPPSPE